MCTKHISFCSSLAVNEEHSMKDETFYSMDIIMYNTDIQNWILNMLSSAKQFWKHYFKMICSNLHNLWWKVFYLTKKKTFQFTDSTDLYKSFLHFPFHKEVLLCNITNRHIQNFSLNLFVFVQSRDDLFIMWLFWK